MKGRPKIQRHELDDDARCARCGEAYPWRSKDCREWRPSPHEVEVATRAALGTTPMSVEEYLGRLS